MTLNLKGNQFYLLMCKLSHKELELAESVRTSLNIYTISMKSYLMTGAPLSEGLDRATAVIMRTSLLIKISQIPNSMHERNGVSTKTRPWNGGFFIVND